uniref:non-specific serine/threonine protein kinase n=1 Tax=Aureoumbra lagunensis TaxID=44058 RepID=A0A7S3NP35_9STRA|mmetsp:Transcript_13934/g.20933  ORF Transcript_13934/g.20933 Transcript_13934/m.20933 type:complete len:844 (-) Transcript_13934:478-3009(-)
MDEDDPGEKESELSDDVSDLDGEDSDGYRPGGYHPIAIGDELRNGRYVVIEKLGWGHFSTVWLVEDTSNHKFCALKVQKSAPHYTDAALDEIELLRHAGKMRKKNNGACRLVQLLDNFEEKGPHGRHICMVFELLGANLLSVIRKSEYRGLSISTVRNLTLQLCQGLDFLHGECGIIHTDLKPENILLKTPGKKIRAQLDARKKNHADPEKKKRELQNRIAQSSNADERKKLKKKLKRQKQKANKKKKGTLSEEHRFEWPTNDCIILTLQNLPAKHFRWLKAMPHFLRPHFLPNNNNMLSSSEIAHECHSTTNFQLSLNIKVLLFISWVRIYQAFGPDHRPNNEQPSTLDSARWIFSLGKDLTFSIVGTPRTNKNIQNFSHWELCLESPSSLLPVATYLEDKIPGLFFISFLQNDQEETFPTKHLFDLARDSYNSTIAFDLSQWPFFDLESKQEEMNTVKKKKNIIMASPQPLAKRLEYAAQTPAFFLRHLEFHDNYDDTVEEHEALISPIRPHDSDSSDSESMGVPRSLEKAEIVIVDLGNACWRHKHFTDDIQTRQYRAPEVIVGAEYDTSADVWSLACVIFELLTGDLLFDPRAGADYDRDEDHLAQMQELLGRYPKDLATQPKARTFFNRHAELKHIHHLNFWDLSSVLTKKYHHDPRDAQAVADFLLPMLQFYPKKRATAADCLRHPWLYESSPNNTSNNNHVITTTTHVDFAEHCPSSQIPQEELLADSEPRHFPGSISIVPPTEIPCDAFSADESDESPKAHTLREQHQSLDTADTNDFESFHTFQDMYNEVDQDYESPDERFLAAAVNTQHLVDQAARDDLLDVWCEAATNGYVL